MTEYIGLVIILFLLSIICERLADFLKNYLGECNTGMGLWLKNQLKIGDLLDKKKPGSLSEEQRYYRILKINIWCGFFIAWALNANLFNIIANKRDPFNAIGWNNVTWFWEANFVWSFRRFVDVFVFITGCFATGLFISFGSKFWHDLLDILYQVKNYRRLLADPYTYKIDNIKSFDRAISTYESDFIKAAFHEARTKFMAMENVEVISLKIDTYGYYFEISVHHTDSGIDNRYTYYLDDGTIQSIRIKIILLSGEEALAYTIDLSGNIFQESFPDKSGTLGCLVKEKSGDKLFILTCCHNVVYPISTLSQFEPGIINACTTVTEASPLGKVVKVIRDHEVDAALVEVLPERILQISNTMPQIGSPNQTRIVYKDDVGKVKVCICGARSGYTEGTLMSAYTDVKIRYADAKIHMINLIALANNGKSIAKPGDSGSVVFDENNNIIGLVIGGTRRETYAMPIETVLTKMNVQLAKS
jgi:hypothetical protein